ncbi:MAG: hypothetical protein J5I90_19000 [Caldilineales bacterium]|nr:hypothetical protein [Caldilineales bacterium]
MNQASDFLISLGLPAGDRYDLPASTLRFPDGAHYRIEIPSVEGPGVFAAVIDEAQKRGVTVHRVSQGSGMMLQTDAEIRQMAQLGFEHGIEVCLFVGPRAPWEGAAQALTPNGQLFGWRHMGMDQLRYALDDIFRGINLGIRSILVADEGLTWLVGQARQKRLLPPDLIVKASALMGAANPVGIRMLVEAGIDTVNVASDSSPARLAALRQVIDIPIDLYVEAPDGLGGFIRYYELPNIIRVSAPIHLKFGLRNAANIYPSGLHLDNVAQAQGREKVRRAAIALELMAKSGETFQTSKPGAAGLGIPVIQS